MKNRFLVVIALVLAVVGCNVPESPGTDPPISQASSALDGGSGSGGNPCLPLLCGFLIEPEPPHSPIATVYTGIPVVPCTTNADCDAVAECRHAGCNTDCGFCQFLEPASCEVDGCPGHSRKCESDADCTSTSHYDVECSLPAGKCIVLPPAASHYDCDGPGEPYYDP